MRRDEMSVMPPRESTPGMMPVSTQPKEKMIVQLGRFGDIINILPFALYLSKKIGAPVPWLVSEEHKSILEGVSYVKPVVWPGGQDTLHEAIRGYTARYSLIVTQAWMNPDKRRATNSFAKEQWRHAGAPKERGAWPLLYPSEEHRYEYYFESSEKTRPKVLVATQSISTPYRHADRLIAKIRGLNADVVDLDEIKMDCVWDLIGIYDNADCLVTIDTMHLHLARASYCPVVALINDGWRGAVPPPQTIFARRYAEIGIDLSPVVEAVERQIERTAESIAVVIHTYQPDTDRHKRAMATHPKDAVYAKFDHRPKVRELLMKGLEQEKDIVLFTNDDVAFPEGSLEKIRQHAQKWDFGCSRRPRDPVHIGREVFWFRSDWLEKHWDEVPDCYWSVQKPDLILARWMRGLLGITTTAENLYYDFPPVELPAGIITHEEHASHWANHEVENSMEGRHNEAIWKAMK